MRVYMFINDIHKNRSSLLILSQILFQLINNVDSFPHKLPEKPESIRLTGNKYPTTPERAKNTELVHYYKLTDQLKALVKTLTKSYLEVTNSRETSKADIRHHITNTPPHVIKKSLICSTSIFDYKSKKC